MNTYITKWIYYSGKTTGGIKITPSIFIPTHSQVKQIKIREYDDVMETRALVDTIAYQLEGKNNWIFEFNVIDIWEVDTIEEDLKGGD